MAVRDWLLRRHSLWAEVLLVVGFYFASDASRGLASAGEHVAVDHASTVVSIEQGAHVFVEHDIQNAVQAVPSLSGALGFCYLIGHVAVTSAVLLWLHGRRPAVFAVVRTTLMVATLFALVGYVVFPTAPPRLADLGISNTSVGLESGPAGWFYNPYAAVPSMHIGYAVVIGAALFACGRRRSLRILGVLYPLLVLFVIVATGNHFFFDAAAGAAVSAFAFALVTLGVRSQRDADVIVLDALLRRRPPERLAA